MSRQDENKSNRRIFMGLRSAAASLYGPSGFAEVLARLPADTRRDTVDTAPLPEWIPSRHIYGWYSAVFEGPAQRDDRRFEAYVEAFVQHAVRRFFRPILELVSPERIASAIVAQYRRDHQRGTLRTERRPSGVRILFSDHGIEPTPFNVRAIALSFKHGIQLSRVKQVSVATSVRPNGEIDIDLSWPA